jgi:hypothetical protein
MPCFSGVTPVSIETWEGRVTDIAVVIAHIEKLPRLMSPRRVGAFARRSTSGRRPSMLTSSTRLATLVAGSVAVAGPVARAMVKASTPAQTVFRVRDMRRASSRVFQERSSWRLGAGLGPCSTIELESSDVAGFDRCARGPRGYRLHRQGLHDRGLYRPRCPPHDGWQRLHRHEPKFSSRAVFGSNRQPPNIAVTRRIS